jgi:aldose 1-epimerase
MKTKLITSLIIVAITACTSAKKPFVTGEDWGTVDSRQVYLYTLTNSNGVTAKITNYGGIITEFNAPDRDGNIENIVLGMASLDEYLAGHPYFGSIIGRYADIIEGARFTLDSTEYTLTAAGHGGRENFSKKVWNAVSSSANEHSATLSLEYVSADMEEGYPGNMTVKVDYVLNNNNELQIHYVATTDKPTVVNLTNHSYFNLANCREDVLNHQVRIYADTYTPYVDNKNIPTGEFAPVESTPYDLREWTVIGDRLTDLPARGYDDCFCIKGTPGNPPELAAELYEPKSGRLLQTYTTEPGLQFYIAYGLNGRHTGTQGAALTRFMGACFEAQHFANSPNQPNFPTTVLRPGETYTQVTIYKAGVK